MFVRGIIPAWTKPSSESRACYHGSDALWLMNYSRSQEVRIPLFLIIATVSLGRLYAQGVGYEHVYRMNPVGVTVSLGGHTLACHL